MFKDEQEMNKLFHDEYISGSHLIEFYLCN